MTKTLMGEYGEDEGGFRQGDPEFAQLSQQFYDQTPPSLAHAIPLARRLITIEVRAAKLSTMAEQAGHTALDNMPRQILMQPPIEPMPIRVEYR